VEVTLLPETPGPLQDRDRGTDLDLDDMVRETGCGVLHRDTFRLTTRVPSILLVVVVVVVTTYPSLSTLSVLSVPFDTVKTMMIV